jgi:hypothetical protein
MKEQERRWMNRFFPHERSVRFVVFVSVYGATTVRINLFLSPPPGLRTTRSHRVVLASLPAGGYGACACRNKLTNGTKC